jgi:hypothetical protein
MKTPSESTSGENEARQFARRHACDSSLLTKDMPAIPAPFRGLSLVGATVGIVYGHLRDLSAGFGARPLDQCGGALT